MKKYMFGMMKKYILGAALLCVTFASCDDFFEPETSDALSGDDYMSSLTEMTTGYLGILTKMQAIGDKEIYLTDTRGELLEPTEQSIAELIALYNYDDDLTGNSYADPAGYYDLVIACNDYIAKMQAFHKEHPELIAETDYFCGLMASAYRVKAWTYLTLGEIYGQALWFDDPITSIKDVNDKSIFTLMPMETLVNQCINLLEQPIVSNDTTFSASEDFSWIAWVDPEHVSSIASSEYRFWDQMTPPYEALISKLKIWSAAYKERRGEDATSDYQFVADQILDLINKQWSGYTKGSYTWGGSATYWKRGDRTPGSVLNRMYDYRTPNQEETVGAILYDYTKNQCNKLLYHFSDEYPNAYLLAPNDSARLRFQDTSFTPLGTGTIDQRINNVAKQHNDRWYIARFRPVGSTYRTNAYQDDVHIYTFRIGELYLWLSEALNHLGRYEALDKVINGGFNSTWRDNIIANMEANDSTNVTEAQWKEWKGFTSNWVVSGTGKTYTGFRGCLSLGAIDIWDETEHTAAEARQHNDSLLCQEWVLECACEGKAYPNMNRFAEHYKAPEWISNIVGLKYRESGKESEIKAKIEGVSSQTGLPGYWVPWSLN